MYLRLDVMPIPDPGFGLPTSDSTCMTLISVGSIHQRSLPAIHVRVFLAKTQRRSRRVFTNRLTPQFCCHNSLSKRCQHKAGNIWLLPPVLISFLWVKWFPLLNHQLLPKFVFTCGYQFVQIGRPLCCLHSLPQMVRSKVAPALRLGWCRCFSQSFRASPSAEISLLKFTTTDVRCWRYWSFFPIVNAQIIPWDKLAVPNAQPRLLKKIIRGF